jgi:hypothetical protein
VLTSGLKADNHPEILKPFFPSGFRSLAGFLAATSILGGCAFGGPSEAERSAAAARTEAARTFSSTSVSGQRLSIPELDQLTYGYADRFNMVISSAVNAIKRGNPDPEQRRVAHQIRLNAVLAMNDVVSGNDPYAKTLDLVVSVTLDSILLIDENRAEEMFGERAPALISAIRTMRIEAWELAARVLTQDQLELLDYIILEWRRTHPHVEQVSYVKFDNFAGARAAGLLTDLRSGDGFLAPLSEASEVLKDWARLTERIFWYSKRAPDIAAIQAEGTVNEILSAPEINALLQTAERLGKTAEAMPRTVKAEREAFFAELEKHQGLLTNVLGDVRKIMVDVNSAGQAANLLTTNLQQALLTIDLLVRRLRFDEPSARPFDIQDYTAAITRLNEVVMNVQQLSSSADQFTRSEGWQRFLKDMTDATDRRLDSAFVRVCLALGLAFILAVVYRVISVQLKRRMTHASQERS